MGNIQQKAKIMCKLQDRRKQVEFCRILLLKQHISGKFGNGTRTDRIQKTTFETNKSFELQ